MTLNLYVMPIVGTGTSRSDPRRPKYSTTIFPALQWGMFDYGNEPWCLVGVVDIDVPTDSTLSGEPDVLALPANLDQAIGSGAALTRARTGLESVNIPGTWLTAANTWRDAVRFVGAVCQFAQRYQGATGGVWFTGGVTLASTFNSLPQAARDGLTVAAESFGFDTSGITGTSTLRQILLSVGQQYLATQPPLVLANVTL
jgi:hypothetical protein